MKKNRFGPDKGMEMVVKEERRESEVLFCILSKEKHPIRKSDFIQAIEIVRAPQI